MKKVIFTLVCCALIAPLAFGKDSNKRIKAWHFAFVSERPITITAPGTGTRVEGGVAASFQPANVLLVYQDGPGHYVVDAPGRVFNSKGEAIHTRVRPGARLLVYFGSDDSGVQTIDRVVVD
jgi:hypothetical protein